MPQYGLEEVPRPVLGFLLDGCKQKPREALIECLRELADEGLVRYETDATGMPVIRRGLAALRAPAAALRAGCARAGADARWQAGPRSVFRAGQR
jgi:hypothetical protein